MEEEGKSRILSSRLALSCLSPLGQQVLEADLWLLPRTCVTTVMLCRNKIFLPPKRRHKQASRYRCLFLLWTSFERNSSIYFFVYKSPLDNILPRS